MIINKKITQIFLLLATFFFSLFNSWFTINDVQNYIRNEKKIISSAVDGGAREIKSYVGELKRIVNIFVNEKTKIIEQLAAEFTNEDLYKQFEAKVKLYFPNYFAFTLANESGISLLVTHDQFVGPQCQKDLESFTSGKRQNKIFIHPKSRNQIATYSDNERVPYHFDIMTKWSSPNSDLNGTFFISFKLKDIMTSLEDLQPHNWNMLLVDKDNPKSIEVMAKSSIKAFDNKPILPEDRLNSVASQKEISGTDWLLIGLPHKDLFHNYKLNAWIRFTAFEIIFIVFMIAAFFILKTYHIRVIESENNYKNLVERAVDGIALIQDYYIVYANPYLKELLGYTGEELRSLNVVDLFHSSEQEKMKSIYFNHVQNNEDYLSTFETRLKHKNKTPVYVEISASIINYQGNPADLVIIRDITKVRESLRVIKDQKNFLENIINSINHPFYVINAKDYTIDIANNATCKIYNIMNEKLTCHSLIYSSPLPCNDKNFDCPVELIKKNKTHVVVEHSHLNQNNEKILVEVHAHPIFNSSGEIHKIIMYSINITERKKKEQEILKLTRAIEQSPAAILVTDNKGFIEYVNPAFLKISGYHFNEVIGQNPKFLKSNHHNTDFYKEFWQTIKSGDIWIGEFANRNKKGEIFWERASIASLKDEQGNIINFIGVKLDITEQKRLEQLKQNTERMVNHDIKNPLSVIMGFSQLIMMDEDISEDNKNAVHSIYKSANKILYMVEHSLDIYKMETGTYKINKTKVNLLETLKEIETGLNSLKQKYQVSFIFNLDENAKNQDQFVISAEKIHIENLFSNLMKNAIEASPKDQNITVSITKNSDYLVVNIHNFGMIPETIQKTFFDPYITSGKKGGTGLGTHSASVIAKAHNGKISFTTDELNGTNLIVELPIE